jgi:phosphotransferase system HPr (HPr) family protein
LHFLEAVTALTHFVERHEGTRADPGEESISSLVSRDEARSVTLNDLFFWANAFMQKGRGLAEDLLPSYTNVQELEVEVSEDVVLHARPASLIVGIVTRYATPVEMEVGGEACNAGSMLSLMVLIGSHPKEKRFVFRGDEKPLRDIGLLFQAGLGEGGMETLPDELDYLRGN